MAARDHDDLDEGLSAYDEAEATEEELLEQAEHEDHDGVRGLDRFGIVFILSSITMAGMSLFDLFGTDGAVNRIASTVVGSLIGLTLVMAARASGVRRRARRFITSFVGIAVAVGIWSLVTKLLADDNTAPEADGPSAIWVAIALMTPGFVVRRLIRHRRVTIETLYGAISAYLLVAIGFAYLYRLVAAVQTEPFFTSTDDQTSTEFAYFSLTTITTLGYGDLSPATDLGRLLATTEALIGQVYLVVFVAMIVGLFIAQHADD